MKNILLLLLLNSTFIFSQDIVVPVDTIVKTFHETTIKGKKIKYTAETGMQPVWDNDGKPIASLFYTYYKRNLPKDSKSKSLTDPLLFHSTVALDLALCGCILVILGQEF